MTFKLPLLTLLLTVCCFFLNGQIAPAIQWQKNIGTDYYDNIVSVAQTRDGGYVAAGYGMGSLTSVFDNKARVVKLRSDGSLQWEKYLSPGSEAAWANAIQQTSDGGYIVGCRVMKTLPGGLNDNDGWLVKLDSSGDIVWSRHLGGSNSEGIYSVHQTRDKGYIFVGSAGSTDGDVIGNHGNLDVWVVKMDSMGSIEWNKCYGGSEWDQGNYIQQTAEGGYIISGVTRSVDGDVSGFHPGVDIQSNYFDAWVLKINATGIIEWQKCLGGNLFDEAMCVRQTNDGGYIVASNSKSNNGDVSINHGGYDVWMVKLNPSGSIVWEKSFGGSADDDAISVKQTIDGGFVIAGGTGSIDGDIKGNHSLLSDCWILKLDSIANIQWQKCLGGTDMDGALDICQTSDGGFFIGAVTYSSDGDLTEGYFEDDGWAIKLSAAPVPLMITEFTAQKQQQTVLVKWQTQNEINVRNFLVEKSRNTIDFVTISDVPAAGNPGSTKDYSIVDEHPFIGMNYYRLKQIARDNSFVYSRIVSVDFSTKGSVVFPNPAADVITVAGAADQLLSLAIFDAAGKLIQRMSPSLNNQYYISYLPGGFYTLKLMYNNYFESLPFTKL